MEMTRRTGWRLRRGKQEMKFKDFLDESNSRFLTEDRHLEEFTKKLKLITNNLERLVMEFLRDQKYKHRGYRMQRMEMLQVR